jgi:hypothetical protein
MQTDTKRLPHPTTEAEALVMVCEDNLDTARAEARYNYQNAADRNEAAYWFCVIVALRGAQA